MTPPRDVIARADALDVTHERTTTRVVLRARDADIFKLSLYPEPAEPVQAPRRRFRGIHAIGLLILAAAGGWGAWWYTGAAAAIDLRLAGVVEANEVVVAPKIAGRVTELTVNEGDTVERGAVVARLDRAELEAERQRDVAAIAGLAAKLGQSHEMVAIESDRTREETRRADARLRAARSERDQAAAELSQAQKDAARAEALSRQDMLPRQELDRAHSNVDIAAARLRSLNDQVSSAEADLALAQGGVRQVVVASGTVDSTRAELQQAQAQLAQIDTRLADTVLRAPLAGVVSLRVSRQGEVVEAGSPVVTIIDPKETWVRASVEERVADAVRLGDDVDVDLSSGVRLRGRVTQVSAVADFATRRDVSRGQRDVRSIGFKVALPADPRVHSGMTAYVNLPRSR